MKTWRQLGSVDIRSLAAFRIASGALVLIDLIQRSLDMKAFYTDQGVFPRIALLTSWSDPWRFSLLLASGSLLAAWGWWFLTAACAMGWMVGWKTRWAGFFTWLLLLSWQWRAPLILHGGDALLLLMIFWCLFLPTEALWSLDAASNPSAPPPPQPVFHIAAIALLAQVVIMYEFSAFMKARWIGWTNGDAIYFALNSDFWTTALGRWLFGFPWIFKPLSRMILWYEWIGPLLLFSPWATTVMRLMAMAGFCAFQASIGASLHMGLFPVISMAAMIPFLPGQCWDCLGIRVVESPPGPAGMARRRRSAIQTAWVSCLWGLLIWFNLWTLKPGLPFPMPLQNVCRLLAFDHRWNLFSDPATYDGWLVAAGRLRDGTILDLMDPKHPLDWSRPAVASRRMRSVRWGIYLWSYTYNLNPNLRSSVPAAYCAEWNAEHPGEGHLEEASVYFMRRHVFPRFNTIPPERILLATQRCPS